MDNIDFERENDRYWGYINQVRIFLIKLIKPFPYIKCNLISLIQNSNPNLQKWHSYNTHNMHKKSNSNKKLDVHQVRFKDTEKDYAKYAKTEYKDISDYDILNCFSNKPIKRKSGMSNDSLFT